VREDRPSVTAAWVAAMRGLGTFLPVSLRLVDDPFGLRFAGALRKVRDRARFELPARAASRLWLVGPLRKFVLYMQFRTRVIDDDVAAFARAGGRQLVLLGAGFDCRAWRLGALAEATVFEVDHPATQGKKRAVMGQDRATAQLVFVPWDFEDERLQRLPARLGLDGHNPRAPTMTVLEGVLMYLTEEATEATFESIARYSAPGSPVAFTYMDRALLQARSPDAVRQRRAVRWGGEPFRFGFEPAALAAWLNARGFRLERDESSEELASRMAGADAARAMSDPRHALRHFALARRV
jgi:methyltransferase (TIGR00027 family)